MAPSDPGNGMAPLRTRVTPEEALEAMNAGALTVDIRAPEVRHREGSIDGAVIVAKIDLIDTLSLRSKNHLPRRADMPVIMFCGTDDVSGPYVKLLSDVGIDNIVDVAGGFPALKKAIDHRVVPTRSNDIDDSTDQ